MSYRFCCAVYRWFFHILSNSCVIALQISFCFWAYTCESNTLRSKPGFCWRNQLFSKFSLFGYNIDILWVDENCELGHAGNFLFPRSLGKRLCDNWTVVLGSTVQRFVGYFLILICLKKLSRNVKVFLELFKGPINYDPVVLYLYDVCIVWNDSLGEGLLQYATVVTRMIVRKHRAYEKFLTGNIDVSSHVTNMQIWMPFKSILKFPFDFINLATCDFLIWFCEQLWL